MIIVFLFLFCFVSKGAHTIVRSRAYSKNPPPNRSLVGQRSGRQCALQCGQDIAENVLSRRNKVNENKNSLN